MEERAERSTNIVNAWTPMPVQPTNRRPKRRHSRWWNTRFSRKLNGLSEISRLVHFLKVRKLSEVQISPSTSTKWCHNWLQEILSLEINFISNAQNSMFILANLNVILNIEWNRIPYFHENGFILTSLSICVVIQRLSRVLIVSKQQLYSYKNEASNYICLRSSSMVWRPLVLLGTSQQSCCHIMFMLSVCIFYVINSCFTFQSITLKNQWIFVGHANFKTRWNPKTDSIQRMF